jgi:hypothetical protein
MTCVALFYNFINEIKQNAKKLNNQLTIDKFSFIYFGVVYFSKAMQKWTLAPHNFDTSKGKWERQDISQIAMHCDIREVAYTYKNST